MSISRFEQGTCLYYTYIVAKIIFGDNLTSAFMKISGVLIIITGIGMLTASYMYGLPLLTPSYSAFGIGGGILVLGYGASCLDACFKGVMQDLRHEREVKARLNAQN